MNRRISALKELQTTYFCFISSSNNTKKKKKIVQQIIGTTWYKNRKSNMYLANHNMHVIKAAIGWKN